MDDPRLRIAPNSFNSGEELFVRHRVRSKLRELMEQLRKIDSNLYASPGTGCLYGLDIGILFRVIEHLFPHVRGAGTTTYVAVGTYNVFSIPTSMAICKHRSTASGGAEEGLRDLRQLLIRGELVRDNIDPTSHHKKYGYMHVELPENAGGPSTFFVDSYGRMWGIKQAVWWSVPRIIDTFAMVDTDGKVYTTATWTPQLDARWHSFTESRQSVSSAGRSGASACFAAGP
eukprot:jgi/Mesvir1/20133/Mv13372-RA.1